MSHILLLTDFSENSKNAIRYALQLFESEVCSFYLLHVQNSSAYTMDDLMSAGNSSIYDSIVTKSKLGLKELVNELDAQYQNDNHSFETVFDYDALTDAIKQVVTSKKIDLVVMGTNGVTGAKEVVFGSNTINVIRKINCPTLVIPSDFKYRKPKEMLLPLDLFDSLGGNAFAELMTFVKKFKSTLHLLRIKPDDEPSKEEQNDSEHISYFLKGMNYRYHVISNIPMHFAVDCYTQTHNIDITALLVQSESLFERFFTGSSTTQISNNIRVPLLIIHSY